MECNLNHLHKTKKTLLYTIKYETNRAVNMIKKKQHAIKCGIWTSVRFVFY